jgi:hypothetical protein
VSDPPVSWKALERGAVVVSSDEVAVGRVVEVAGDVEADIFNGLVVRVGTLDRNRYLPAERVEAIWRRRVTVSATQAELRDLPAYDEPVLRRITSREGLLGRLRRLLRGR